MSQDNNQIVEITKELLDKVGFEGEVKLAENSSAKVDGETTGQSDFVVVSVESENNLSMLIGKNGQNLSAFDHIVHLMVNRKFGVAQGRPPNFIVDVNDYRKSKTNYLINAARDAAKRVIQTRRAEALSPMNAYERRLVHTELAVLKDIQTESIGQEPRRRVVIKPQLDLT